MLALLALICFAVAAILAGIQRAWTIALIAAGLAVTVIGPALHVG